MKRFGTIAASILLAAFPAAAIAQDRAGCATYGDLQVVSSFALPGAIDAIAYRCRDSLGDKSFLRTSGAGLSARLRASGTRWEQAAPVFARLSRLIVGTSLGGEFASGDVVDRLIASSIAEQVEPSSCGAVDRSIAAVAALPASRMVDFLATLFVAASGEIDLTMCPAA